MKNTDKITLTLGQLKTLIKESRQKVLENKNSFGYVYLSEIFHKDAINQSQKMLRNVFKHHDGASEELDEEVRQWLKDAINLPRNEWITPKDLNNFIEVVWDRDGAGRGYGISPALKFRNYDSAENCAYLLSDYGNRNTGWGYTRNWIGRTYP